MTVCSCASSQMPSTLQRMTTFLASGLATTLAFTNAKPGRVLFWGASSSSPGTCHASMPASVASSPLTGLAFGVVLLGVVLVGGAALLVEVLTSGRRAAGVGCRAISEVCAWTSFLSFTIGMAETLRITRITKAIRGLRLNMGFSSLLTVRLHLTDQILDGERGVDLWTSNRGGDDTAIDLDGDFAKTIWSAFMLINGRFKTLVHQMALFGHHSIMQNRKCKLQNSK